MKKLLITLLILLFSITLVSCGTAPVDNSNKEPDTVASESKNENNENANSEIDENDSFTQNSNLKTYSLSSLPGSFGAPKNYYVYSDESGYTAKMCKEQGFEYDNMATYLSLSGNDVMMIPKSQSINNKDVEVYIKVKSETDFGIDNLKDLNDTDFDLAAKGLISGFKASEYDTVEGNGKKFIVFKYHQLKDTIRYATIINGKMIYVFAEFDKESNAKYEDDLKEIALSLKTE